MKGGICTNSQQNYEKSLFYAKNANKGQRIPRHSAAFRGDPRKHESFWCKNGKKPAENDVFERFLTSFQGRIPRHSAAFRGKASNGDFGAKGPKSAVSGQNGQKTAKNCRTPVLSFFQTGYGKFGGKNPNFSEKAENFAFHARSCLQGSFAPTFNHIP